MTGMVSGHLPISILPVTNEAAKALIITKLQKTNNKKVFYACTADATAGTERRRILIMEKYLLFLDHLSYIIECIASDTPGEAKHELDGLIARMESDDLQDMQDKEEVIKRLRNAEQMFREDQHGRAVGSINGTSRMIWMKVIDQIKTDA